MNFKAGDYSVNIIAIEKNNLKYGMSCAWLTQVDYDKLVCLLGSQSVTSKVIEVSDKLGVSALSKNQKDLARFFGDTHSDEVDKFSTVEVRNVEGALLIPQASREMLCEVIEVIHLKGIEEDTLLYLQILDAKENNDDFLHNGEV